MSAEDAEHVGEVGVTRSRRRQVVGPHDLFDTLRVVIDDHDKDSRQVRRRAGRHRR